jgi:cell wall-associated NlpC family hydrolase
MAKRRQEQSSRGGKGTLAALCVMAALVAAGHHHHGHHGHGGLASLLSSASASAASAQAISYARAQIGCQYVWGGTGPCGAGFDCSGLVMQAYASAGVTIPRTSEDQWADLPHVPAGDQVPGDLVFFAGSDGTTTSPGHVGLVLGPHRMIEAYSTGFPVRISHYGTPDSPAGDQNPVGFAAPGGG